MAQIELFKDSLRHHGALSTALVSFIQSALRVSFLFNGGAIVAALSVYGARNDAEVNWPSLVFWAIGLAFSALSTYCITKAQREFQVSAGLTYRKYAREFFDLDLPVEASAIQSENGGQRLRNWFWRFWFLSVGAFTLGAVVAICALV